MREVKRTVTVRLLGRDNIDHPAPEEFESLLVVQGRLDTKQFEKVEPVTPFLMLQ